MSPLVKYLGNASPEDNTEVINLKDAEDGQPRSLIRGGDPVEVDGDELLAIASNYEIEVVEDGGETSVEDGSDTTASATTPGTPPASPAASGSATPPTATPVAPGPASPASPGASG